MVETNRVILYPANQEEMESYIAIETCNELRAAYSEMLEGCLQHPDEWEWYAMWMIETKDRTHIGDLCFKGINKNGVVEIGYGILEEYQGQGYATEAVQAVIKWAFQNPDINAIEAEAEVENIASQKVLKKCGFVPNGEMGEEGPRFSLTR